MFFHGMFHPHHNSTWTMESGMQLVSALVVEQELEESRERRNCSTCDDKESDRCERSLKCHKKEF